MSGFEKDDVFLSDNKSSSGVLDDTKYFYDLTNVSVILKNDENFMFSENFSIMLGNASSNNSNTTKYIVEDSENFFVLKIILTVIYVIIFITGVLGNVVTCIVISKNRSMHTAVNYYLFSLAISDLFLLISALPDEFIVLWELNYPFNETICKLQKFAAEVFTNATVLTITAFTVERYVAICKPFLSHTMSKLSRACKLILIIWLVSICLAVPQTLFTLHLKVYQEYRMCVPKDGWSNHLFVVSTLVIFVVPMTIITFLYILIGLQLRRSKLVKRGGVNGSSVRLKRTIFKRAPDKTIVSVNLTTDSPQHFSENVLIQINENNKIQKNCLTDQDSLSPEDGRINYSNRAQLHGTRHVVNMLVVVVVAFFLCWSPFHAQRLLSTYLENTYTNQSLVNGVFYLSGVLFYVSTCINPFLYNIMSNKFRQAFKETIATYLYGNDGENGNGKSKFFRTMSQRSYSNNSQSANTCSSICSSQPINHQHSFRYLDSDLAKKRPLVVSFRHSRTHKGQKPFQQYCTNFSYSFDPNQIKKTISNNNINESCRPTIITPTTVRKKNRSQIIHLEKDFCDDLLSNYTQNNGTIENSDFLYGHLHSLKNCPCIESPEVCSTDTSKLVFPKEKYYGNAKLLNGNRPSYHYNQINNIRDSDNNFHGRFKEKSYFSQLLYSKNPANDIEYIIKKQYLNQSPIQQKKSISHDKSSDENCPAFIENHTVNSIVIPGLPFNDSTGEKLLKRQRETAIEKLNKKSKSLPSLFGFSQ